MITIKIPVTPGRRETIVKSTDIIIELHDEVFTIKKRYLKETPKDPEEEFSPVEQRLWEVEATIKKNAIALVCWAWQMDWEVYQVEINLSQQEAYSFNMKDKEAAIELYNQILNWWLV